MRPESPGCWNCMPRCRSRGIRWGRSASNRSRAPAGPGAIPPNRLRATYHRKPAIRYIFDALDVHRERLYAQMRPRRGGSDGLRFMGTIRLVSPAHQKIYRIQDALELVPTPPTPAMSTRSRATFAQSKSSCSQCPITATGTRPSAASLTTPRTATAPTATIASLPSSANTESPHELMTGQPVGWAR
jgi:hypothetical protein